MSGLIDITGKKFGKLTVIARATNRKKKIRWNCICDCGQSRTVVSENLRTGHTVSCGCVRGMHRQSRSVEFSCWDNMIQRCSNPKATRYDRYGGRGIKVCERWLNSFENFLADVGKRPSPNHSIDRYPNGNGNYEPGNVRWATGKQQQRNISTNNLIVVNGEKMCLVEASERFGVNTTTIANRLRRGLPMEAALSHSYQRRRQA
jgi:hypothetical protein